MDPNNQQPAQPQPVQSSVVEPPIVSKHFHLPRVLLVLLVALTAAAISGVIFYMLGKASGQSKNITSVTATTQTKVSVLPTTVVPPTIAQNDTANWQTYTSSTSGISFKYPPGYGVADNPKTLGEGIIVATSGYASVLNSNGFGGMPVQPAAIITIYPILDLSNFSSSDKNKSIIKQDATIDGIASTQYKTTFLTDFPGIAKGTVQIDDVVPKNNKLYDISLLDIKNLNLFNEFLATFKFTK